METLVSILEIIVLISAAIAFAIMTLYLFKEVMKDEGNDD